MPGLLLGQWSNSPKMVGLATDLVGWARDNLLDGHDAMGDRLNVDTAGGVWF